MGSCSFLHRIFPTQVSNPGLLQGRWIFYQLSYQWSLRPMDFYKYYILGWEEWEQNEHIYLHRFTNYFHKFMNQENEPIWIMQIWKLTTIKKNKWWLSGKEPAANAGDTGDVCLIPGSGSSPGEGNGNPLQYTCLGNSMGRGAWQTTVHGVAKKLNTTEWLNNSSELHPSL